MLQKLKGVLTRPHPHLNQVNGRKSNHPRMWSCEDPFHSITNGGNLWKSRFSELSTSNYFLSLKQELPFGLILLPLSFLVHFFGLFGESFWIPWWNFWGFSVIFLGFLGELKPGPLLLERCFLCKGKVGLHSAAQMMVVVSQCIEMSVSRNIYLFIIFIYLYDK